jgi:hypothetical protein
MLRQLQPLPLVVAAALAVEAGWAFDEGLIDQPGDDLAVFQQEGGVVGADLEHALGACAVRLVRAEAGIEEAVRKSVPEIRLIEVVNLIPL